MSRTNPNSRTAVAYARAWERATEDLRDELQREPTEAEIETRAWDILEPEREAA